MEEKFDVRRVVLLDSGKCEDCLQRSKLNL